MDERALTLERIIAAPRPLVWGLVTDTDRADRALGLAPPRYAWRELEGRRQLVGTAKQNGVLMEWIEDPSDWVENVYLHSRRRYLKGPLQEGGLRFELEDKDEGTLIRVTAWTLARAWYFPIVEPALRGKFRRKLRAYLDDVQALLETEDLDVDPEIPATVRVRRLLQRASKFSRARVVTPIDRDEFERRSQKLANGDIEADARERLLQIITQAPDEEVTQMRPFELARAWRLERKAVLRCFLLATEAGLVDLCWQINCPVCRVAAGVRRTLGEVEQQLHCEACNVRYDIDFGENVEAVFSCNEAVRAVRPTVYCAASPAFRPHVVAQRRLAPFEVASDILELHDGRLRIRTLGKERPIVHTQAKVPARLRVDVDGERVSLSAEGDSKDGRCELEIASARDSDCHVLFERAGWAADAVFGSVVASLPAFVDLFATEAPAMGLELNIGTLTFLFTDLTGSTALYERIGDARAYAIVQEHFMLLERIIDEHDGAVVKTMGDAVMATFNTPTAAVRAACRMIECSRASHEGQDIGIKVGVHEGPCLAVRANDRLDYFGTTVNVAARLQARAVSGELVMMAELAAHPSVAAVLERHPHSPFRAALKGIRDEQALVRMTLGGQ